MSVSGDMENSKYRRPLPLPWQKLQIIKHTSLITAPADQLTDLRLHRDHGSLPIRTPRSSTCVLGWRQVSPAAAAAAAAAANTSHRTATCRQCTVVTPPDNRPPHGNPLSLSIAYNGGDVMGLLRFITPQYLHGL